MRVVDGRYIAFFLRGVKALEEVHAVEQEVRGFNRS